MTPIKSLVEYHDDYATCHSTYATLCIYPPGGADPAALSEKLGLRPSRTQVHGEEVHGKLKNWPSAWFLGTQGKVETNELRQHIDWLLDQVEDKAEVIQTIQAEGAEVHLSCFWVSAFGHGGPMLDQYILKRLARLNIGISFDIYFAGNEIDEAFDHAPHSDNEPGS